MRKGEVLVYASYILIVLGAILGYLGGFHAPKLLLPPIITGIGFWVVAVVFYKLRK